MSTNCKNIPFFRGNSVGRSAFFKGMGAVDFYVFLWVERTRSFTASLKMTVDPKTHQKEFDLICFPFTGKTILFQNMPKKTLYLDYFHLFNAESL
jgi:hypothetical protein